MGNMPNLKNTDLARFIDHTLLKPEATGEQITALCREAVENNFCSVCVNPYWVPTVSKLLQGSSVDVCTVIGFPLGATTTRVKALEVEEAIAQGANEVDMVLNVGALKSGAYDFVLNDIKAVVKSAQEKAIVKVILETGLLNETEKIKACELSVAAGANFVKTSTGFGPGGATVDDIALMRRIVGPEIGVKASGGVRDYDTAIAMIKAGASRIGTSSGVKIIAGAGKETSNFENNY
jgi:deoxyribose-phosphate aldolase